MKKFKIHIPYAFLLLGPILLFSLGFMMNAVAAASNNGKMSVLGSIGCPADSKDVIHGCMETDRHLRFLSDWILNPASSGAEGVSGPAMMSPGDLCLLGGMNTFWPGLLMWGALVIKDHHDRESKKVQ